jgi:hypothetical protein
MEMAVGNDSARQDGGKAPDKRNPGPSPERLRLEGPWEEAVDKALGRKRPVGGWPKKDQPADEEPAPEKGVEKPDPG